VERTAAIQMQDTKMRKANHQSLLHYDLYHYHIFSTFLRTKSVHLAAAE